MNGQGTIPIFRHGKLAYIPRPASSQAQAAALAPSKPLLTAGQVLFLAWFALLVYFFYFKKANYARLYLILSGIVGILAFGLQRRKRRAGELSAYSLLNPNHERIFGGMSSGQLVGQLGGGGIVPLATRGDGPDDRVIQHLMRQGEGAGEEGAGRQLGRAAGGAGNERQAREEQDRGVAGYG